VTPNERIAFCLDRVCSHLPWPVYRARVRRELTDHILSRAACLQQEHGFSESEAIAEAVLLLGDPDKIGCALRQAHRPLRHLAGAMVFCLLWGGILFCAVWLLTHLG